MSNYIEHLDPTMCLSLTLLRDNDRGISLHLYLLLSVKIKRPHVIIVCIKKKILQRKREKKLDKEDNLRIVYFDNI